MEEDVIKRKMSSAFKSYDVLERRGLMQPNCSRSLTLSMVEDRAQALREFWSPEVAAAWEKRSEKERSELILGFNPTLPEKVNAGSMLSLLLPELSVSLLRSNRFLESLVASCSRDGENQFRECMAWVKKRGLPESPKTGQMFVLHSDQWYKVVMIDD